MVFEWDEAKERANLKKHGIPFEIATDVFDDPYAFTLSDCIVGGEERLWIVGRLKSRDLVAVVVHTVNDDLHEQAIRIISARKATPNERKLYEEAHD